jgi:hypothetical protein
MTEFWGAMGAEDNFRERWDWEIQGEEGSEYLLKNIVSGKQGGAGLG